MIQAIRAARIYVKSPNQNISTPLALLMSKSKVLIASPILSFPVNRIPRNEITAFEQSESYFANYVEDSDTETTANTSSVPHLRNGPHPVLFRSYILFGRTTEISIFADDGGSNSYTTSRTKLETHFGRHPLSHALREYCPA
ncbi:hypothetical protein Trydic_g14275 [Trypoxylus dichotomus]